MDEFGKVNAKNTASLIHILENMQANMAVEDQMINYGLDEENDLVRSK